MKNKKINDNLAPYLRELANQKAMEQEAVDDGPPLTPRQQYVIEQTDPASTPRKGLTKRKHNPLLTEMFKGWDS